MPIKNRTSELIRDITNTPSNRYQESKQLDSIIFTGCSKLPANSGIMHSPTLLVIEIEVDPHDMMIIDADCPCLPILGQKLLTNLMIGRKITDGFNTVVTNIRKRYLSVTQRALIAAIDNLEQRCQEFALANGSD